MFMFLAREHSGIDREVKRLVNVLAEELKSLVVCV